MTTDFQQAGVALGARLRELRPERGCTGRELASELGWPQSKVSKLETGRQTATADGLQTWALGTGRPEAAEELTARLRTLESRSRSWRRQLTAGHKPVQDALTPSTNVPRRSGPGRGYSAPPSFLSASSVSRFTVHSDSDTAPSDR
ncbi:helix-turn-helix domain-containing protein [Streptomyces sp. NPDC006704]|uniref:helix-turn-helix domain-containing protein n=1 Tax=Streptomyces sp. NPDC006704 TaxID=3364760 RepID=UPI00368B523C